MVGTSKILTVSYGTFSCTLEGFDDSFSTMKAIAEYFRGLASDDRYFGAEPPTPDAEMLAQIAEREISRRVDASMDDNGIVLRATALTDQSDTDAEHDRESRAKVDAARKTARAAKKAEKAKARSAAKAEKAKAKAAAKAEAEAEAEDAAQAKAEAKAKVKAEDEAKAEDAAKAEQDVISKADQPADKTDDSEDSTDADILSSVSAAQAAPLIEETGYDAEETHDNAPSSLLAANDPAPASNDPAPASNDPAPAPNDPTPAAPVSAHPDSESVAAKLQRIRAVVGTSEAEEAGGTDELSAQFLPQTQTLDVADPDTADNPVVDFDAHEEEMKSHRASDSETIDEDQPAQGSDMIARVIAGQDQTGDSDAVEDAATPPPAPEAETAQPRVRVVRMKRADFDKAMEAKKSDAADVAASSPAGPDLGMLDGADDLDDYLEDSDFAVDASLKDDVEFSNDLAEIQSDYEVGDVSKIVAENDQDMEASADDTLGAVASAMAEHDTDADPADTATAPAKKAEDVAELGANEEAEPDADERTDTAPATPVDESALDRLMSETDAQMQEPEGSRRRDAIAQLKAAVAAKKAARQVGETDDDGQDVENAFRNDLSEVTRPEGAPRPRPVVRSGNRTERPRAAPLKLVAAQRVDMGASEQRDGPVVPRRVATRVPDPQAKPTDSFAEFVESMGASDLPDLLEAAAAYTAFVEGADEFSRPQILRRARAVASDDFNREDGLRSFAALLRSGRFTKVRNGRFQVADDSRYNPERRAG